ncbi:putative phosphatase, C-terminal domain of histone macro H2A1 like protein [Sphaerochaeta pleomorpha str. Grapes]|uniref:Putative phosphatase, C-terminal domain of histone macro H2A1 like protein n=1 Tax=Sphaerochaeta pleomorpha (strain ATCC BAA-1885 / DSM 22778 / Grapes) TaxID=158190 RepID=G8QQR8_SPHPG|nr:macro domain-containing protein [Sphaerochaeta pleomorpha]AEV28699.1 putative phosphatase, C-terminal domain of histone macro H2A1 like protein [Sphaerochaeta pleomorpha str. Grapes]
MPFMIVRNDITKMKVDAIVNSANPHVAIGRGVDSAIHAAAGPELFEARKVLGDIPVGSAVATPAFNLDATYVIHTVGPLWKGGTEHEIERVLDCYRSALQLALAKECKSVAFPLISTGTYGFPKAEALQIALSVISEFLLLSDMEVYLVVYDRESYSLSGKLFKEVVAFIDEYYVEERSKNYKPSLFKENINVHHRDIETVEGFELRLYSRMSERSLDTLMAELEESFSQSLLRIIDEKGKTDVEVYKKANVDRKLFSKIRSNKDYRPSKVTAIAFALALELNLDETKDLIGRAGFSLTRSNKFDVIIEYFIEQKNYNVFEINEVLFAFDQILLGV